MSKRGHGQGSIRQRKDLRWEARLMVGFRPDGKPSIWRYYGKTQKEALAELDKARRRRDEGRPVIPEKQTVAEYLAWWLDNCVKPPLTRPNTYRGYEANVRRYLAPHLGSHQLGKLTAQHVQTMTSDLAKRLSPRTVEYALACLHIALEQAVDYGLVGRNVADRVRRPKKERTEHATFTPEQARAFLAAIRGDRLEALYVVTVALGLRQGEALGLRWSDVDLDAGTLRVSLTVQRVEGKLALVEPKTARSRQTLPLPGFAVVALREHRARQAAERLQAGPEWADLGLVFCSPKGRMLDGPNVTHRFQKLLADNDLPRLTFHELRHTCGTLLMAMGVPMPVIRDVLRHTSIGTTADFYTHVSPLLAREALDKLGGLLAPDRSALPQADQTRLAQD